MNEQHPTTIATSAQSILDPVDLFEPRHIGPSPDEISAMLRSLGFAKLDDLSQQTLPSSIQFGEELRLSGLEGRPLGEFELVARLRTIASENQVLRSCIGMGYSDVIVPPVIQRNVLENPGWYTQYTPYQAEIAQGVLE